MDKVIDQRDKEVLLIIKLVGQTHNINRIIEDFRVVLWQRKTTTNREMIISQIETIESEKTS